MLRIIIVLAWIPLLWEPTWGQSPGIGKDHTVVKPPNGCNGSDQDGRTDERGSKDWPFVVDTEGHQQSDAERAQSDAKEQRARDVERWTLYFAQLSAWATVVLVLIGFGGVVAAIVTLLAIKRQADLQERSIRPWVGTEFIEDGSVYAIGGERIEVHAVASLKNTGPSIAMDGLMLPWLISSRTSELPDGIRDAWNKTREVLANRNNTKWETGFVLHPGRSHRHSSIMGSPMPFSELEAGVCFVLICAIYRDQFDREHTTQDCFRVKLTDTGGVSFDAVPAHQKAN